MTPEIETDIGSSKVQGQSGLSQNTQSETKKKQNKRKMPKKYINKTTKQNSHWTMAHKFTSEKTEKMLVE